MADPKPKKTYELKISWMKKENELQSKIIEQLKSLLATPHSRLSPAGSCVQCKTFCNIDHRKYNLVNIENTTKPSPKNSFNPRMLRTIDNLQMKYGLPGKEQKCITVMERQCKQMPRRSCQNVETGDCMEDLPGMSSTVPNQGCETVQVENYKDVPNTECKDVQKLVSRTVSEEKCVDKTETEYESNDLDFSTNDDTTDEETKKMPVEVGTYIDSSDEEEGSYKDDATSLSDSKSCECEQADDKYSDDDQDSYSDYSS